MTIIREILNLIRTFNLKIANLEHLEHNILAI